MIGVGRGRLGCDAFADHSGGEGDGVFDLKLEITAASVAVHVLVAIVLCFDVDYGCAVRALAFVLGSIVPLVVVVFRDLGKCFGFGCSILTVLAWLADEAVRMTPRCLC